MRVRASQVDLPHGRQRGDLHAWAAANRRAFAGQSWEIYGDWHDDVTKVETDIVYLLP
jgi:hypothetical protein